MVMRPQCRDTVVEICPQGLFLGNMTSIAVLNQSLQLVATS